jgi:CRISPR-associated endonuclease Csn1
MKKILGLDLGSSSIGWAMIETDGDKKNIKGMGVRLIPILSDEKDAFSQGKSITINKDRTQRRTARKTNHRYKQRKAVLIDTLEKSGMMPDKQLLNDLSSIELYGLRDKALKEQLSLQEIGRIFFHLNQKRGYRSSRKGAEQEDGKKMSDYLTEIKERKDEIERLGYTIGQYFYHQLENDIRFRVKENVFPRQCYINEFNAIWQHQAAFYPDLLTADFKRKIGDHILFFQRPLKSAKNLVGKCQFEKHHKVTPRTSPLFQIEKIWESIHNISFFNKRNESLVITLEQKKQIFEYLDNNEKMSATTLIKLLGIAKSDGWHANELIKKSGIQGNTTKGKLLKAFSQAGIENNNLLQFNLVFEEKTRVDVNTGEIISYTIVNGDFEREPLYQLWHVLYSIEDADVVIKTLKEKFMLSESQASLLCNLDFTQAGFGNKSAKAIRKILPYLTNGSDFTNACKAVGYNHSNSITKEENLQRELAEKLEQFPKNSLRQPIVEKVLNQLVNVVNAIIEDNSLGKPDEIRIELARELKQSKEERSTAFDRNNKANKMYESIKAMLEADFPGLVVTKKILEKYRLFEDQKGLCIYSGQTIELNQALTGQGVDIDHIIPQTKYFDDSYQNRVLVLRKENANKGNSTAFDYMQSKGEASFQQYIERINMLFDAGALTKSKRNKLLTKEEDIPQDFLNRQLNETRFITKESVGMLKKICTDVWVSTGSVTEFLRNQWGYNEILKQLKQEKYNAFELDDSINSLPWSKRDDHRHHAVDALVVACTKQGYIQKLNTLNSRLTREDMKITVDATGETGWQTKRSLLDQYIRIEQPFTTDKVKGFVENILISQKAGKKVVTTSVNKLKNGFKQRTLVPRGPLHQETVYGKIKRYSKQKALLNGRFNGLDSIVDPVAKQAVAARLHLFDGDAKLAFKDLDKNPIWLDDSKTKSVKEVTLWEEFYVVKYTLNQTFKENDVVSIIDERVKEKVFARFKQKGADAMKNLEKDPIWLDDLHTIPILSVRCFTGLNDLVALHTKENGLTTNKKKGSPNAIEGDFVKPANNHHIAIYLTQEEKKELVGVSFWEAVRRKNKGLPVIVNDPAAAHLLEQGLPDYNSTIPSTLPNQDWTFLQSIQQNELFVMGMSTELVHKNISEKVYGQISRNLFRVQKISISSGILNTFFRNHLETRVDDKKMGGELLSKQLKKVIIIQSVGKLIECNPIKVKINHTGYIELV